MALLKPFTPESLTAHTEPSCKERYSPQCWWIITRSITSPGISRGNDQFQKRWKSFMKGWYSVCLLKLSSMLPKINLSCNNSNLLLLLYIIILWYCPVLFEDWARASHYLFIGYIKVLFSWTTFYCLCLSFLVIEIFNSDKSLNRLITGHHFYFIYLLILINTF